VIRVQITIEPQMFPVPLSSAGAGPDPAIDLDDLDPIGEGVVDIGYFPVASVVPADADVKTEWAPGHDHGRI
jgi:hypothetical protein